MGKKEIVERFGKNSLATLHCALRWESEDVEYIDGIIARRVNAWRDIFPPGILERLDGCAPGDTIFCNFAPGSLVPPHEASKVLKLSRNAFVGRGLNGERLSPRIGRFYPQGMLQGIAGVYPSTMTPARIIDCDETNITVDLNHPLARHDLRLDVTIDTVQEKKADTGGQLSHWGEEICDRGPGMQARLPGLSTDFLTEGFFERKDRNDADFYAEPRLINHVDMQAHANLSAIHRRFLRSGMKVLDLMSSVQTHVPDSMDLQITGLGLNMEELQRNPRLHHRVVHDLNHDPSIPADGLFDAVLISLSIEYLDRPKEVLRAVHDLLAPGGVLLVGMSDRWFPTKTIRGWPELHEFERMGLVHELMRQAGFTGAAGGESIRNDWRPQIDRHFLETRGVSDPVFVAWGYKGTTG